MVNLVIYGHSYMKINDSTTETLGYRISSILFYFFCLFVCLFVLLFPDAVALLYAHFGQGSVPIVMDEVGCTGSESRLIDCNYDSRHSCSHREDASVRCDDGQQPDIHSACVKVSN